MVRLTIHHSLSHEGDVDLEVARGATIQEIVSGFSDGPIWCGTQSLEPTHRAGRWPLLAGAILSAQPRGASVTPTTLHLAAIAGPDAGVLIPINAATVIGSTPPSETLNDDAIDAQHATISPTASGHIRVTDNGSINGTGVWRRYGSAFSWRGRRRAATVRVGDVIAIGHTLLEVRQGLTCEPELDGDAPIETLGKTISLSTSTRPQGMQRHNVMNLVRAAWQTTHAASLADRMYGLLLPRDCSLTAGLFPDPTRTEGWEGPIAIGGAHAVGLARAVILARGRRPPAPMPIDEPWLAWLPRSLPGDGPIRMGVEPPAASSNGWTILVSESDRTVLRTDTVSVAGPVVRVSTATADTLARSRAGSTPDAAPSTVHWADAAALSPGPTAPDSCRAIVAGVRVDTPASSWEIVLDPSFPHTLIAGAPGTGKTTLLATIAGALAINTPPRELALVILCTGDAGALDPYLDLPHVTAAASHVGHAEALRLLSALDLSAALTVIIVDDIDALGPDGGAVTAHLESIAAHAAPGRVHVVMSTHRPTAVLTPTLRAGLGTAVALRAACEADSVEVTGTVASASLQGDAYGMAYVRSAGRLERVQAALPYADAMPRVRRCDIPLHEATSLATAALRELQVEAVRLRPT